MLLTELDLIHELFLPAIFICASLLFVYFKHIPVPSHDWQANQQCLGNSLMWSPEENNVFYILFACGLEPLGSTFWMSQGQTPYFLCFFVLLLCPNGPHAIKQSLGGQAVTYQLISNQLLTLGIIHLFSFGITNMYLGLVPVFPTCVFLVVSVVIFFYYKY